MAGRTPNIDKLAAEGMLFTDYYAEASCTAGRAQFITGELPIRTGHDDRRPGRLTPSYPGHAVTIATVLSRWVNATGQFGKNHLGALNESCRRFTASDEFFGYSISRHPSKPARAPPCSLRRRPRSRGARIGPRPGRREPTARRSPLGVGRSPPHRGCDAVGPIWTCRAFADSPLAISQRRRFSRSALTGFPPSASMASRARCFARAAPPPSQHLDCRRTHLHEPHRTTGSPLPREPPPRAPACPLQRRHKSRLRSRAQPLQ